jgi:hypothetical protein
MKFISSVIRSIKGKTATENTFITKIIIDT